MREMLRRAVERGNRRLKRTLAICGIVIAATAGFGLWRIHVLKQEKTAIDARINALEVKLAQPFQNDAEADRMITQLESYQDQAQAIEGVPLYRLGGQGQEPFVALEIRLLLHEFGADSYSVPPEFVQQVSSYLKDYEGPDRANMIRALGEASEKMARMREIFLENHLPPDLAYMTLVESGLDDHKASSAGAAGLWQFTPATAEAFGLEVHDGTDERLSIDKETRAACKYMRSLILDFGAGSSVMLALAAYNSGPSTVKKAIDSVKDPIKQRNFWYLYRIHALPLETREYVPRVIAAMIIGRHPERFGF